MITLSLLGFLRRESPRSRLTCQNVRPGRRSQAAEVRDRGVTQGASKGQDWDALWPLPWLLGAMRCFSGASALGMEVDTFLHQLLVPIGQNVAPLDKFLALLVCTCGC